MSDQGRKARSEEERRARKLERQRRYRRNHPDRTHEYRQEWRAAHRDRYRAHRLVEYALKRGAMRKPPRCDQCGARGPVEAHHDDYTKPLEVRWLCDLCHRTEHREEAA